MSYESTCATEFALVDIDAERLEYAGRIIERIFRDGGYENAALWLSDGWAWV